MSFTVVFKRVVLGTIAIAAIGAAVVASGCATRNPSYNSSKAHHRPNGFTNNYGEAVSRPLTDLIRWQREASRQGLPKPPSQAVKGYEGFPVVKPDLALLADYKASYARSQQAGDKVGPVTATWIGHATVLVQLGGLTILTDPHFGERASPVSFAGPKRRVALPVSLNELPRIDLVLISHNHYDHLDVGTVAKLKAQPGGEPLFLAPLGVDLWLKSEGINNVMAFDWWDEKEVLGVKASFVPAQHWSSRSPFDRNATLWGGWVINHQGYKFYFAGDSGYSKDFADIGAKFQGFDLSLIPVGAYEPRWFMKEQHVNPAEAVQIHQDVKSRFSIGVHWGSFELTDEPLDQPLIDLPVALRNARVSPQEFVLFKHGETRVIRQSSN